MDTEVARTLAELERKLADLERALSGAGAIASGGLASGARLVDERLEGFGSAPLPPIGAPAPAQPPVPPPTAPIPGPAVASPSSSQCSEESIELAELARFRDRLEQAMRDLLADYERVIRLRSVSETSPPVDRP